MIEITHKQAQHLIREGLDRPLPDAQWAVLQTHLERCSECTAYRDRITASQRGLTHALRLRWSSARGPKPGATKYLVDLHDRRVKRRKWLVQASRYGLALLLLVAYLVYRSVTAPEPPKPLRPAAPTIQTGGPVAVVPTPSLIFRGLVAFEEQRGGDSEIVLLNVSGGQVDRSNLTSSPSNETHPAWSPDGEWIAFLSDRSGKNEIYLMTVAGSRLTQITSTPEIDWQGPLEWSADGSLIALTGRRAGAAGDPFLYLVPTAGGTPRAVAFTRGVQPWARFSPSEPLLAYPAPGGAGIQVLNTQTGRAANAAPVLFDTDSLIPTHLEAFDWALGGRNLLYTAVPSPVSSFGAAHLRMSPEIDPANLPIISGSPEKIAEVERPGGFRAVTAVPSSLLVASLEGGVTEGCWTIRLDHAYNRMVAPRRLADLCVEGGLESDNWTGDGNWLVVLARRPSETAPSIYAVRLPDDDGDSPLYERLGEAILIPGGENLPPGPALRVRRIGRRLALDPQPAQSIAEEPAPLTAPLPTAQPPATPEDAWIYYTVRQGLNSQIFRAHPNGTQPEPLTGANADLRCPRVGPDGRVAYVSNMGRAAGTSEIFVMDGAGNNHNLLTRAGNRRYLCPVWSPDGTRIAAFNVMQGEHSLAVMPSDGSVEPIFLPVDLVGLSEPVWLPNDPDDTTQGSDRLLVAVPQGRNPVRLLEFDLRKPEGEREIPAQRAMLTGWDDVWGLTLSPDGRNLAMALVFYNRSERVIGPSSAQLRVVDLDTLETQVRLYLSNFSPELAGQGSIAWLSEARVGVLRSTSLIASQKSVFEVVDLSAPAGLVRVARFEDIIFDAAWTPPVMPPEGEALAGANPARVEWGVFTSESGLWVLDLRSLSAGSPFVEGGLRPAQIDPRLIESVDWR